MSALRQWLAVTGRPPGTRMCGHNKQQVSQSTARVARLSHRPPLSREPWLQHHFSPRTSVTKEAALRYYLPDKRRAPWFAVSRHRHSFIWYCVVAVHIAHYLSPVLSSALKSDCDRSYMYTCKQQALDRSELRRFETHYRHSESRIEWYNRNCS